MRFSNEAPLSAITGNTTSDAIEAAYVLSMSIQSVSTGTLAGTLKVQVSNDKTKPPSGGGNWTDLSGATITVTAASTLLLAKTDMCYRWFRLVFTASGGAGSVTANVETIGF